MRLHDPLKGGPTADNWRYRLRREMGWFMVAKLGGLIILWGLFFSASHRLHIDGTVVADRLAVGQGPAGSFHGVRALGGDRSD